VMRPGVTKLRTIFPVHINPERIAGVPADVIEPTGGIAQGNKRRVLINLHGGGFRVGTALGGQMESIPIASLGAIKVISVDYRQGPEHKFPAASEDVAAVYREVLKRYPANNVGIYGCSAGGMLTAEAVAWFQTHGLPRPGAIGIFGSGALVPTAGDSNYFGTILTGGARITPEDAKTFVPYFDIPELNIRDPLVSPAYSPSVLKAFPPTLLISGTRDIGLSSAVYTHSRLVKLGVDADLHVWEGAAHCIFAEPAADPEVPETREAWDVIVKFFDKRLGK
jgi:epsilon-lactone hydrolase